MPHHKKDKNVKLIVGLGNPGDKYKNTRHNIGFLAVDEMVNRHSSFRGWAEKFKGHFAQGTVGVEKALLLKPMTFMNLSGESVRAACDFFKIDPQDVIVIHDELDLPVGKVRIKKGGGDAGHNGLKSITKHLGTPNYVRIRVGIDHPRNLGLHQEVSSYVLHDFNKKEREDFDFLCVELADALALLMNDDYERVMTDLAAAKR